ncbi:hypothetical protein MLD38_038003 [Melastoma candidum]|uniref:Uncharacterized protein n=1 Tax=Melastoma candidum TaxID=119954 RepID=A0ACB9KYE8_9MYRT|nr:hypothetical protein MLD38_038003 [Melastoma candidum]
MGKHLNKVLGRGFKSTKFKPLVTLALSRLSVLRLHRQVRSTQARNDVLQLLQFGHRERALLRVEQVIKEHNLMDAYAMIEGYFNLLVERADLIEGERECPEELKEAIATLIYAASRCGDFPELQEIRSIFTSHFGREFAARAVELRNNCGVNVTMIMKLSTRQPSLESRMKVLQEIATEHGISLNSEGDPSSSMQENKTVVGQVADNDLPPARGMDFYCPPEICQDSVPTRKFKDVADAAQAAFQSAAHAAAAARAAVELSRSAPQDPENQTGPDPQETEPADELTSSKGYESDQQVSAIENSMEEGLTAEEAKRCASLLTLETEDAHATETNRQEEETMIENIEFERESEDKEEEILIEKSPTEKENVENDNIELQNKAAGELSGPLPADEKAEPKPWFPFQKHIRLKLQAGRRAPQPAATTADQETSMRKKIGFRGKPFFAGTREVRGY